MGIRPVRKRGVELPAARLYLDDVKEIAAVLIDSCPQDPSGQQGNIQFIASGYNCDSVDDLEKLGKERGRRARSFEIEVASADSVHRGWLLIHEYSSADCNLRLLGAPASAQAALEIRRIFESRGIWWKNALSSIPESVFYAVCFLLGASAFLVPTVALGRRSTVAAGLAALFAMLAFTGLVLWARARASATTVYLEYSHAKRGGFLSRHWEAIVVAVICAALGAAITILVQRLFK